jgi:hypothetical protein
MDVELTYKKTFIYIFYKVYLKPTHSFQNYWVHFVREGD